MATFRRLLNNFVTINMLILNVTLLVNLSTITVLHISFYDKPSGTHPGYITWALYLPVSGGLGNKITRIVV